MTRGVPRVAIFMLVAQDTTRSAPSQSSPASGITPDVQAIARIDAVKTVLRVLLQTTGLRLAVVARVTALEWRCCAVLDEMGFGLKPGDTLAITTTFCNTVRTSATPLLVNHASQEPCFSNHPAPRLYGVESYIAVPLYRRDGTFFGVMCALDSNPAALPQDKLEIFRHLGDLIGHQLENQDELERSEAQLFSEKEAAVLREQLLGIVSHDLRNPLNAILMSAATLVRRTDLDERARRAVRRIVDSADRAQRLIRDLLDFTQARMGQVLPVDRQPLDLHELTQQVAEEVQAVAPERVLEVRTQGIGRGAWDADRIAQVLHNLLANAMQYSPPGARIQVSSEAHDQELVLRVHNDGPPIPLEVLPTLFEPMKRGTTNGAERRSVGLGLFIVDQIARAHGGSVEVASTQAEGTTFSVHLPRRG
ncbi:GAF domain-containing sensor histidine kinase [Myxococcus fulvus]